VIVADLGRRFRCSRSQRRRSAGPDAIAEHYRAMR
jgi:hypothetical protein